MKIVKPCKVPCKECPYRKDSLRGYFAGQRRRLYSEALQLDTIVACHTNSDYDDFEDVEVAVVCTGHIVAQINSCKSPRSHEEAMEAHAQIRAQDNFEDLKEQMLSSFDFDEHHDGED